MLYLLEKKYYPTKIIKKVTIFILFFIKYHQYINQMQKTLDDGSTFPSNKKQSPNKGTIKHISKYICIHIIYWILMGIALLLIIWLQQNKQKIQNRLKISQTQLKKFSKSLTQQKQILEKDVLVLSNSFEESEAKIDSIHKLKVWRYYDYKLRKIREHSQRRDFFRKVPKSKVSYLLSLNNFKYVQQIPQLYKEIKQLQTVQYQRLSKQHNFSLPQQPFCIVIPTINNGKEFRYQFNIISVLNQNYTNFKVVIIDDASTDQNFQMITQFVQQNPVSQKIHLVKNKQKMGALYNIYQGVTSYCQLQDIVILVDGDDELLGTNILKVFNSVYTLKNLEVLYSNLILNDKNQNDVKGGWSSSYTERQKKYNKYRESSTKMFPLRSFKASIFRKINQKDFKDEQGEWFRSASDQTICPQVLQLSCGKNEYIDQYFYLYNFGLGNNDIEVDADLNYGIMNLVQSRDKYQCPLQ